MAVRTGRYHYCNGVSPVLFTQYLETPSTNTIGVQTTVTVPDGGTVLMGGLKVMSEGRNEYGPPILSQIPYLNRLFKNPRLPLSKSRPSRDYVKIRIQYGGQIMPAFMKRMNDEQIAGLLAYLESK